MNFKKCFIDLIDQNPSFSIIEDDIALIIIWKQWTVLDKYILYAIIKLKIKYIQEINNTELWYYFYTYRDNICYRFWIIVTFLMNNYGIKWVNTENCKSYYWKKKRFCKIGISV